MSKVILCVLDGFGHAPDGPGNAIRQANTPFLDKLFEDYAWTLLEASGEAVGLPAGAQGGSEVGHLTMGAGRVVWQSFMTIQRSITSDEFFHLPKLTTFLEKIKSQGGKLHLLGMISDQGVHAHIDHCLALLKTAKQHNFNTDDVLIHGITDGRDVLPQSAIPFTKKIEDFCQKEKIGQLATLCGRYYAMDRDKNWDRTEVALNLLLKNKTTPSNQPTFDSATEAIQQAYDNGLKSDYYLEPTVLHPSSINPQKDGVIFFNFRTDRAAQLTEKLIDNKVDMLVFGPYTTKAPVLFPAPEVANNLGEVLAKNNKTQVRIAETEKYAHVTFFFNSQIKESYPHEKRIMVPSVKCPSFAEKPAMSAQEIAEETLKVVKQPSPPDFIAINFANLDLVGHSADLQSTIKATETIDHALKTFIPAAQEAGYSILLTGDHGNAEAMITEDGQPNPSHTRNPVPLIVIPAKGVASHLTKKNHNNPSGSLADIAPTILNLLGVAPPSEMTGQKLC